MSCVLALLAGGTVAAHAAECPGHPDALGTSRVIAVDPTEHPRIGTMQYPETLPLQDHEVVLTFDDGPLPPSTDRILDILASQCVKATYFIVGRMAHTYPATLRRIYREGHTIGTHTQDHPLFLNRMPLARSEQEVDEGIATVSAVLGDPKDVAPFLRIPGLSRTSGLEQYVGAKGIMIWSADFPADDWKHISPAEIVRRALSRIEAKGKGILLLHDIHPATATALPTLLHELKVRGYRIVQVVPASPAQPKTQTVAAQWRMHPERWRAPALADLEGEAAQPELPVPGARDFVPVHALELEQAIVHGRLASSPTWPPALPVSLADQTDMLPVPALQSFGYSDTLRPMVPSVIKHAGHFSIPAPRPARLTRIATHSRLRRPTPPARRHLLGAGRTFGVEPDVLSMP